MQAAKHKPTDPLGVFLPGENVAAGPALVAGLRRVNQPLYLLTQGCDIRVMTGTDGLLQELDEGQQFNGMALACSPETLGSTGFCHDHAIRYPYVGDVKGADREGQDDEHSYIHCEILHPAPQHHTRFYHTSFQYSELSDLCSSHLLAENRSK